MALPAIWASLCDELDCSSSSLDGPTLKLGSVIRVEMSRSVPISFSSSQDSFLTRRDIEFRGQCIRIRSPSLLPMMLSFRLCCKPDLEVFKSSAEPRGWMSAVEPRVCWCCSWKADVVEPKCGWGVWLTSGNPTLKTKAKHILIKLSVIINFLGSLKKNYNSNCVPVL